MKKASEEIPEIKLEVYGSGPERASLRRLIEEKGMERIAQIKTPVPQADLRTIYNRASVVVLNSTEEGFGLALTEAMLCRRAVIGADSGGIVDIIEHEKTGLLFEPDNVPALTEAIVRILKDEQLRSRLAEAGYQKALNGFSSDAAAKKFAELYRELA